MAYETGVAAQSGEAPLSGTKTYIIKNQIDLDDIQAEKGSALAAADVIQLLKVPARTFVHQVMVEIVTAAVGTALTANIGDGSAADGFDAAASLAATAGTVTQGAPGTDAYLTAGGKFYATADTIDATLATVTAVTGNPVLRVFALCSKLPS